MCVMCPYRLKRSSVCDRHFSQVSELELEFGRKVADKSPPVRLPIKHNFSHLNTSWLSIYTHTPVLLVRSRPSRSWRGVQSGPPAGRLDTGSAAWRPPAARRGSETMSDWRLLAPGCAVCCPSSAIPWSANTQFFVTCAAVLDGTSMFWLK